MLNFLYIDKTIFSRYWKNIIIWWLILSVIWFFWYNNTVYEEDKITFITSILISCTWISLLLLTLMFRKQAFLLYLFILYIILINFFFIDFYNKIKLNIFWNNQVAMIIDKNSDIIVSNNWIKSKINYIKYTYEYNWNIQNIKEIVNYNFFKNNNVWDQIKISTLNDKSTIIWNIPYLYFLSFLIVTFVVSNILYRFIKNWKWIWIDKHGKNISEEEKEERKKRWWEFID